MQFYGAPWKKDPLQKYAECSNIFESSYITKKKCIFSVHGNQNDQLELTVSKIDLKNMHNIKNLTFFLLLILYIHFNLDLVLSVKLRNTDYTPISWTTCFVLKVSSNRLCLTGFIFLFEVYLSDNDISNKHHRSCLISLPSK